MHKHTGTPSIREAVGVFFETKKLEETIADLKAAGFPDEAIGLLAGEATVRQQLGHLYADVNKDTTKGEPNIAFVANESVGDTTTHGLSGALYLTGAAVTSGAVVATAGILGGAIAVAAATTVAFSGIAALLVSIMRESDAEYLEEQVDEGHFVLFARTLDKAQEETAIKIMSRHSAYDPRVHTVPMLAAS